METNARDKIYDAIKGLEEIVEEQPDAKVIRVDIELDEEQALIFEIIKTFVKASTDFTEEELINYLFYNGLGQEFEKFKVFRQKIYAMGNLEPLADELKMTLTDAEKKVARTEMEEPKTMDDYWALGYLTVSCPFCTNLGVWHPTTHAFYCLSCKRKAEYDGKPNRESVDETTV
jgi:exonuclease III